MTNRGREMPVSDPMRPQLLRFAKSVVLACQKCGELINRLDELVEIGFRGREADRVEVMINELGGLEGDADEIEAQLRREIFKLEDGESAVSVMLWYQLIGWVGNLGDHAEKVGNRIRLLIAR